MKPGPATAHANHDESLVVRLYGNDVDSEERSRALDLLAGCEECAALFADLGQIASATAALPVPERPRDFMLTPAAPVRQCTAKGSRVKRTCVKPQGRARSSKKGMTAGCMCR